MMAKHVTGKVVQNNGDTCCFVHRAIADQLCIAMSTQLECEACREKNDIILSHYVAAREVERRRFDLRNYRPPPPLPVDVLFYVRFFIQNKIQNV